ncbi:NUDIX hydrolase domain-like protein [Mucor mucedo]|uniref:NUDIX hydrolase domain-like protein n=1 Tax=Mucor mucedo TaxID=29922 RepID=UPI0022204D96|nr:NUDIX hydrolase domain-like protein [Mucor mucedo]KAI7895183.1 NUDIX hydrolase domain-like protein [Mucor mucedo]
MGSNTSYTDYPAEARTGRENQVYDDSNIRQVAGCIAIDPNTNKVLIISSSKRENVWVLPKGGWEDDETKEQAAARETYEEAGVRGQIGNLVGSFIDYNYYGEPKSNVWFYELKVEEICSQWPESSFRQRKWVRITHLHSSINMPLTHWCLSF